MEDAEAVMRALATQLRWSVEQEPGKAGNFYIGRCGNRTYFVSPIKSWRTGATHFEVYPWPQRAAPSPTHCPNYPTVDAAKAACECHYATGNWE